MTLAYSRGKREEGEREIGEQERLSTDVVGVLPIEHPPSPIHPSLLPRCYSM